MASNQQQDSRDFFLPDLCTPRNTLLVIVIAELVALVLALGKGEHGDGFWQSLAVASLFLQWLALSSAAILCLLRRPLTRLPQRAAYGATLAALLTTTLLLSEAAWQVAQLAGPAARALFPLDHGGFLFRNLAIALIVSVLVLRYFYVQHQWQTNVRREAEARIAALQARIRPHFLFNSMNTIAALIATRPGAAEQAVEDLADLFRASLAEPRQLTGFDEERHIADLYLRLEQLRLGERLRVDRDLAAIPDTARLPLLTLQPLLENAVYHGVEPSPDGATIVLRGRATATGYELEIRNPLPPPDSHSRPGNRLALDNIRQRLELAFPGAAGLRIDTDDGAFRVCIHWPVEAAREDEPA